MHVDTGMAFQPPLDLRCLVGGVVIDDQVGSQVLQRLAVDRIQEADEPHHQVTDCMLFSAFLHETKPLNLRRTVIDNLPRFRNESG